MARTDTLGNFLTDVANAIRAKTGESGLIAANSFDTAIENIPSGGASGIYKVDTIAERDQLTNVQDGDICVVYSSTLGNWTSTTSSNILVCPPQVVLSQAYSSSTYTDLRDSNYNLDLNASLDEHSFRIFGYGSSIQVSVEYSSEDGIAYDRQTFKAMDFNTGSLISGDTITLPVAVSCSNPSRFDSTIGEFIKFKDESFDGIFIYTGNTWSNLNLGVSASASDILVGKSAYTNSGLTIGAFPQNTLTDLEKVVQAEQTQFSNIDSFDNAFSGSSYDIIAFSLDTSNMTSMTGAFSGCSASIISIKNFDSSNVTNFHSMFESCQNLEILDVDLDVSSATGYSCFQRMFAFSPKLEYVNFHCDVKHSVLGMSEIARNCTKLKRFDMRNIEYDSSTASAGYIGYMFAGCTSLEYLDIRDIDLSMFTKAYSNYNTFGTNSSDRVPANCLIIVKDTASKNWLNTNCSWLTNVKTPSEL